MVQYQHLGTNFLANFHPSVEYLLSAAACVAQNPSPAITHLHKYLWNYSSKRPDGKWSGDVGRPHLSLSYEDRKGMKVQGGCSRPLKSQKSVPQLNNTDQ